MDKKAVFQSIFHGFLAFAPPALSSAALGVEAAITGGAAKKDKAVAITVSGLKATGAFNDTLLHDPRMAEVLGKINDAIIQGANMPQQIADEVAKQAPADGAPQA